VIWSRRHPDPQEPWEARSQSVQAIGFSWRVRANGIDLTAGRPDPDFGPGFYATRLLEQAKECAATGNANPEVVHFRIPASALDDLSGRTFASADKDYSDLVMNERTEGPMHAFNWVEGPYLVNPPEFNLNRSGMPRAGY
jgi:Protein of unknown function (DUF3990)